MQNINAKIIQRAIAKAITHDTGDLIRLVNSYTPVSKSISYGDLLDKVQNLIETNKAFSKQFTNFLIRKKRLIDYNNAGGNYKNAIDPISAIAEGVSSIFKFGTTIANKDIEKQKISSQNTQQIMSYMALDEQTRIDKQKQEANLMYLAIGGMIALTGIIILLK